MSEQTQGPRLADAKRQIKHQGAFKKEKYGASRLQLRLMQWADRGISVSSFHPLSFCNFLLELVAGSNISVDGFSSEYRVVQKAAPSAFLHRDHNNHVLDNLEGKKWTDFQPNPTFNSSIQESSKMSSRCFFCTPKRNSFPQYNYG